MQGNLNNQKWDSILDTLYKEQYRLKLGILYMLCSGFGVFMICFSYFLLSIYSLDLDRVLTIYLAGMAVYYKFFFRATKDGYFYRVFLLKIISDFRRKTDEALRQNLKENSAKKLTSNKEI
ncbi:hypothetical protein KDE13_09170 [Campylobacter sp. faydin G-140]|uniref:hypothetical protein n=1 Tax=Campylobacter anatolicus TaxID=2829105 RepID=UPI001B981626|nr:hypothetical protein [Campylobacter anatolicus]MBR8466503.1 hypothetical protein [Campylobacter anatolicus]